MTADYKRYILNFKRPSGTSRGILKTKESWFILLHADNGFGIGECGLLRGLSIDDREDYETTLKWVCKNISLGLDRLLQELVEFPSIQFGLETAFMSMRSEHPYKLFISEFTSGNKGIPINGLVWMGEKPFMKTQITEKIAAGFNCIKLKIGAIDFEEELSLLSYIRKEFSSKDIELRVDANGAFSAETALEKLKRLSAYDLHSIEQPIKPKQFQEMAKLCDASPLPIALDEELIGVFNKAQKAKVLDDIKPQYIILKPSLIGGFNGANTWIRLAEEKSIGWWLTSALESNVGLNAISQFTHTLNNPMPQGLGTGGLYTNNFSSPLFIEKGNIKYNPETNWNVRL